MASDRLSAESVLGTLFEDEFSLDESDSEDGEDVYGYLGKHVLRRNEIEAESRLLDEDLEEDLDNEDSLEDTGVIHGGESEGEGYMCSDEEAGVLMMVITVKAMVKQAVSLADVSRMKQHKTKW